LETQDDESGSGSGGGGDGSSGSSFARAWLRELGMEGNSPGILLFIAGFCAVLLATYGAVYWAQGFALSRFTRAYYRRLMMGLLVVQTFVRLGYYRMLTGRETEHLRRKCLAGDPKVLSLLRRHRRRVRRQALESGIVNNGDLASMILQ